MRGKGGEGVYFVFLKKYIRRMSHDLTFLFLLKFVKLILKFLSLQSPLCCC